MNSLKVWIFQTGEPLHCDLGSERKMRAINLANALIQRGHKVVIWSSAFYHQEKKHRSKDFQNISLSEQLNIRLIPSCGYLSNVGLKRLVDHAQLGLNLYSALKDEESIPDIAFVGYPPIEFAAVATSWLKSNKVPFIVDCKDQWPDIFIQAAPKLIKPLVRVIFYPYYLLGRNALKNATGISSMSPSFLRWSLNYCGRKGGDYDSVLPLSPVSEDISDEELENANLWWIDKGISRGEVKRFFFVGSLSRAFNFEPIIKAAQMASDKALCWEFVICGSGESLEEIKKKTSHLKNVLFPGWIDRPKIFTLAKISIGGLAPYRNLSDFQKSIPNKILDYLSLGAPVITPLTGEVSELVTSEEVGIMYDENKSDSCFNALLEISDNKDLRQTFSKNALDLFFEKYSGDKVYSDFVIKLENLYFNKLNNRYFTAEVDKQAELQRYDDEARKQEIASLNQEYRLGAESVPMVLRSPYLYYENCVKSELSKMKSPFCLEIGAGYGLHTGALLASGANLIASDISEAALRLLRLNFANFPSLATKMADMESLPFDDNQFDFVFSAGSLSYGHPKLVLNEIYRVLKPSGLFICIDSFGHNPVYRINRYFHYLKGNRTKIVLSRIPTESTIKLFTERFKEVKVSYFGAASFLAPVLTIFFSQLKVTHFLDGIDQLIRVRKLAFKIVMVAKK
jgi:glycosyltransferase involved in cell wall biosynthesis